MQGHAMGAALNLSNYLDNTYLFKTTIIAQVSHYTFRNVTITSDSDKAEVHIVRSLVIKIGYIKISNQSLPVY